MAVLWPKSGHQRPRRVDGQWSGWSAFECAHCSCADVVGSIGVTISQRSCNSPAPQNGGAECAGPGQRAAVCARKCQNENQSVNQYISTKCAEHKRLRNDPELTGTGAQLSRFPQRACKVFCDVQNGFGSQRNYRFYGDNLPDGAPCGWDRYCLNGECTVSYKYFWRDCLTAESSPSPSGEFARLQRQRWRGLLAGGEERVQGESGS